MDQHEELPKKYEDSMNKVDESQIPVVNAHSDYGFYVYSEHLKGQQHVLRDSHIPYMHQGQVQFETLQVGGDFWVNRVDGHDALNVYAMLDTVHREISAEPHLFILITSPHDIDSVITQKKRGFLLSIEGSSSINRSLSNLRNFYRLGLRSVAITHNERNIFGDGLSVAHPGGLSPAGIALVEEMNALPMLLDLVHIAEKGFFEALEVYEKIPIVSHSNARGVYDVKRNLTDDQLRAIGDRGGVIGANFISQFLTPTEKRATIEELTDHIDHMVQVAGIDAVGLGPDYVYYMEGFLQNMKYAGNYDDERNIPQLLTELDTRGYGSQEIRKIASENFLRVYKAQLSS